MNYIEIRDQLIDDIISWRDVQECIEAKRWRPWDIKEWKVKRDLIIKDYCEKCDSKDGEMVLQHSRQPRKIDTIIQDYRKFYSKEITEYINLKPFVFDLSKYPKNIDCCPKCMSQVLRFRKKDGEWTCLGVKNGIRCGFKFYVAEKDVDKHIERELVKDEKKRRYIEYLDISGMGKEIALTALDEVISYLSMENIITLCKKCAYVEDMTNLVLCEICKKRYHKKGYRCCTDCGEENRNF